MTNPPQITMIPVESSQIESMGHNGVSLMHVTFKGKKPTTYSYSGVPPELFTQILEDKESVGKAFNALIKSHPTTYPYAKL